MMLKNEVKVVDDERIGGGWDEVPEPEIKKRIVDVLAESREMGLTATDVSAQAGIAPATASKYLYVLEAEGKLERFEVGRANLWRLKR